MAASLEITVMACRCREEDSDRTRQLFTLRSEAAALIQSSQGIADCEQQLRTIEDETHQLVLSINTQQAEFNRKHDDTELLLVQLHSQLQCLRAQLKARQSAESTDRQILDLKKTAKDMHCECQRLVCQAQQLLRDREMMAVEEGRLCAQLEETQERRAQSFAQLRDIRKDIDTIGRRCQEAQHCLKDLQLQARSWLHESQRLQEEIEELRAEGRNNMDLAEGLAQELRVQEAARQMLQSEVIGLSSMHDRLDSQLSYYEQGRVREQLRAAAVLQRIQKGEVALHELTFGADQSCSESEIDRLAKEKEGLQIEVDGCRARVEALSGHNSQLVAQIEMLAREDQRMIGLLERWPPSSQARLRLQANQEEARRVFGN